MKRYWLAVAIVPLFAVAVGVTAAPVQDYQHGEDHGHYDHGHDDDHGHYDHDHGRGHDHDHDEHYDHGHHFGWDRHYGRGEVLPERYRGPDYYVAEYDYPRYRLEPPRPGYRWVRGDNGEFVLVAIATGVIVSELLGH